MNRQHNDLFGAMKFIDEIIIENSEVRKTVKFNRRLSKKTIMLVTALCLLTVFTITAFATRLFGLRDVLINTNDPEMKSAITLSGYVGTKEYLAASEWNTFTESYDPDGSILSQVDDDLYNLGLSEKYMYYTVYTQEMADKLDEITSKYDLTLHSGFKDLYLEDWDTAVGEFIVNDYEELSDKAHNTILSGYMYDDGTFRYDGVFDVAHGRIPGVDYQFSRATKGVFDSVYLNIGDIADYQEQTIMTDSGVELAAALSEYKSVLIAELDSCFVCINVLGGTDMGLTFDDLKELSNTFDFSVIEKVKGRSAQDNQENAENEPVQDVNEPADSESEREQGYVEVNREGFVEEIPVEICRIIKPEAAIATVPEYFNYSVCEDVHTFTYNAWENDTSIYYSVYADEAHTAEQLADLLQQRHTDSYMDVMTENTRVGSYDAVAVYCDGDNLTPYYNTHYFLIPTDYGCIVIEAHFTFEMYEGLYQIMRALFDTLKIG